MVRDLFLFVPAYQVERELADLMHSIPAEVLLRTAEICIIDDGSSDDTLQVAKKIAEEEIRTSIRIESFAKNSGYGAVIKFGLSRAKELGKMLHVKYAVCLHGDGQYSAAAIPAMIQSLENSEAVLCQGSRLLEKGKARVGKMPLYKFLGGKILTGIENCAFQNKLTDRHSGLIAYKVNFLQNLPLEKFSASFDIDFEILAFADARGFRLNEISIPTHYAGEKSNLRVIPYGLRVLKIALRKKRGFYD